MSKCAGELTAGNGSDMSSAINQPAKPVFQGWQDLASVLAMIVIASIFTYAVGETLAGLIGG